MSFQTDIDRFTVKLTDVTESVYRKSALLAFESVQVGSAITGSPGQPVGQYGEGYNEGEVGGTLRASWQLIPGETSTQIVTKSVYALPNEEGITDRGTPYIQRSSVGGRHSVALTVANFQKIVEAANSK